MGGMRKCSICLHEDRGLIDEKIAAKEPFRPIAEHFDVGRESLRRHAQHKSKAIAMAAKRNEQRLQKLYSLTSINGHTCILSGMAAGSRRSV